METEKTRKTILTVSFMLLAVYIFPQDEIIQRSSIPEELLRPRRGEAPRYPIDMVIGALGRGDASPDAYEIARKTAAALLAGNMSVPVLSSVNKVFLEDCMTKLKGIHPLSFRLGSGREEPDGSFSFLVRFVGRDEGITGELYVRFRERRSKTEAPPPVKKAIEANLEPADSQTEDFETAEIKSENENNTAEPAQTPPTSVPIQRIWFFEDLILEEPRSREEENKESRHRFDFSPYERFY